MDKSDIKPAPLIVGSCVSCDGLVRIPGSVKPTSIVRCPHCGQSFSLQQILEHSIPELEILELEGPPKDPAVLYVDRVLHKENDTEQPREKFVVPRQLTIGAKRKRRNRRHGATTEPTGNSIPVRNSAPEQPLPASLLDSESNSVDEKNSFEFGGIQSGNGSLRISQTPGRSGASSESRARASRRESGKSDRPKRPEPAESAPVFEILKIVLGGALAFPIAYLILFWVFRQDPLKLGPPIGKLVPFAVPEDLRHPPVAPKNNRNEEDDQPFDRKNPESERDESDRKLPVPDVDPDKVHLGDGSSR